ncbi:MAG: YihY/virulence factor BrkB family protein [Janthinobacterium lividum]
MKLPAQAALSQEMKRDGSLAVAALKRFSADKCSTLAAGIAFYSAFSLAPTLLMVIAVIGWFYGAEAARGQLFGRIHDFLGNDAAAAIQAIVQNAHRGGGGGFAAILSLALLIVGASATFSSLNTALDVVFPIPEAQRRSSLALMVRVRLVSFGLVLGIAFLLLVSLVLDTGVSFLGKTIWGDSPLVIIGDVIEVLLALVVLSFAFAALIKWLPDAHVRWREAATGGIVSAVLFSLGKKLFAIYLAHAGTANAFGAAGSLAVLLMWLYFSAAVLLLGAEVAAVRGGFANQTDPTKTVGKSPSEIVETAAAAAPSGRAGRRGGARAYGTPSPANSRPYAAQGQPRRRAIQPSGMRFALQGAKLGFKVIAAMAAAKRRKTVRARASKARWVPGAAAVPPVAKVRDGARRWRSALIASGIGLVALTIANRTRLTSAGRAPVAPDPAPKSRVA